MIGCTICNQRKQIGEWDLRLELWLPLDFKADIEGGGGMGDGAYRDALDAGEGDGADGVEGDAAGGFEERLAFAAGSVAHGDCAFHAGAVHVVQEDHVNG